MYLSITFALFGLTPLSGDCRGYMPLLLKKLLLLTFAAAFTQKYAAPFPVKIAFVGFEILACLNIKSCFWKILVDLLQCIILFRLLLQDTTVF